MSSVISIFLITLQLICLPKTFGANVLLEEERKVNQNIADIKPWEVIHWTPSPGQVFLNGLTVINLRLQAEQDFVLYADKLEFFPPSGSRIKQIVTPPTSRKKDPLTGADIDVYTSGDFEIILDSNDGWQKHLEQKHQTKEIQFSVKYVGCAEGICLLPHIFDLKTTLNLMRRNLDMPADIVAPSIEGEKLKREPANPSAVDSSNLSKPETTDNGDILRENSDPEMPKLQVPSKNWETKIADSLGNDIPFWLILILLFLGGILTNLTPCVYPMIPITIRLLSHQGSSAKIASILYGLGILVTYTSLGVIASFSGVLFGSFMASPALNLILAMIMFSLALTMLGFGNFQWLQTLGNKLSGNGHRPFNAFLMGMGAGMVASPCTGPILASLLAVTSTRQNIFEAVTLLGVYSLGFSTPYIFLGLISNKLAKKRFSPRIQVTVKTIFAGAIFSVSLMYLKTPLSEGWTALVPNLRILSQTFGYLSILMLLMILFARDLFERKYLLILPSLVLGIGLFTTFEYRYNKAPSQALHWLKSEEEAFKIAQMENRPILVDAWAEWCVACKKMEVETFNHSQVIEEISQGKWILLKLDLTESTEQTDELQIKYGIQSLPTLAIIPAGGQASFASRKMLVGYQDVASLLESLKTQRPK